MPRVQSSPPGPSSVSGSVGHLRVCGDLATGTHSLVARDYRLLPCGSARGFTQAAPPAGGADGPQ
ncbi:hypothetical protein E2C01_081955 [Portunus trituberculatus]|uniref:Uncharacterized protein n=1 Tax=Portunus trituberculatus TaxID=210409 RepID=A0A5B7J3P7_PORTR|nr:hypothetical protein [Portunus trituberculatus]